MCVTLLRTSKLRTVTNIFTATLGITDLGIICFVLPMWMAAIFIDHRHVKTSGDNNVHAHSHHLELCQITGFVTVALMLVSIATISLISLDRYFCICHPLKYPCHVTSKKVSVGRVTFYFIIVFLNISNDKHFKIYCCILFAQTNYMYMYYTTDQIPKIFALSGNVPIKALF